MKALTSPLRFILLPLGLVLFFSTLVLGQTDPEEKKEPPSEGMQDTLRRMESAENGDGTPESEPETQKPQRGKGNRIP